MELERLEKLVGEVCHGIEGGAGGSESIRSDFFETLEVGPTTVRLVQDNPVAVVAWDPECIPRTRYLE
jgi:hypothetical protein